MADPARKIEPEDTGPTPLTFDVEQSGPQLKSTKITDNGQSSGASIGSSVAANDNDVANDQGGPAPRSSQSTGQPGVSGSQKAGQPQPGQPAQPAGESKVNQSATTAPKESVAQVEPGEQGAAAQRDDAAKQESKAEAGKSEPSPKNDGKKGEKGGSDGEKKEAADSPDNGPVNESDQKAKKQEGDATVAAQDSNPEKAAQSIANQNSSGQNNQNPGQAATAQRLNPPLPAQPRPSVGRRNPLHPNTSTRPSIGSSAAAPRKSTPPTSTGKSGVGSAASPAAVVAGQAAKKGADFVKKGANKVKEMGEQQLADEKSGKVPVDDLTQGPNFKKIPKGSPLEAANAQKLVAEAAARKAGAIAGKFGANKKQQELVTINLIALINVIFLIIELLLIETVVAIFVLIIHIIAFLWWLLSKGRWKKAWLGAVALFLMPIISIFALFAVAAMGILGTAFIVCNQTAQSIPFGIPIGYVTSIGSFFGANFGPFAQICDHLNVHSLGVGGVANTATRNANAPSGSTTRAIGMIDGQVVLVDESGQTLTPLLPNTQLVRPQPLAPEIANQANQAGYLSPASCKLGDIPFSDEVITRNVRLDNGQTKLVAFPIHKTIDCIKNDPAKTTVRSVQLGKVVRLVDDDSVLGKYVTVEYPNGLRVSYYHLAQITPTLALGSILNAGQPIGTMGNTGQISFEGTQMLFELKDANGNWKVFNPISSNGDASVLTTFPCADNAGSQCLLD